MSTSRLEDTDTPFCADNLPLGSVDAPHWAGPRLFTRVGHTVVDIAGLAADGLLDSIAPSGTLDQPDAGAL